MRCRFRPDGFALLLGIACLGGIPPSAAAPAPTAEALQRVIQAGGLSTGVLYDRVLPLSGIERFSGSADATLMHRATWRQLADELRRAADVPFTPDARAFEAAARAAHGGGPVPLAVLDGRYERLAAPAGDAASPALVTRRVFAFTPLLERTWRGADVRFRVDPALWFTNDAMRPLGLSFDPDDGRGPREVRAGDIVTARYGTTGERQLTLVLRAADGTTRTARAAFDVIALTTPTPDDTLHLTASIPYQGIAGTGDAYVRLAPFHSQITNPVVLVEGFDIDNSMNWDELYALMNVEGLADSLAADGFDAVVLNFTDATDAVQRNAFVVEQLIAQLDDAIDAQSTVAVIGASMGGLCSRYALAYMETHGLPHRVRTWISFDTPHGGANIPLGIQYWVDFFSGQSADAALLRDELDRPAARQMLIAHYTTPPTNSAAPDPLRATMLQDFALVGGYPAMPRKVAVVNGSGEGADQGFQPADQLVRYEYSELLVALTGNIWALRDQASQIVFDGRLRILFSTTTRQVTISGAPPWDGAPGGWRASMAEMAAVPAPYGDIVALHPNHCFIPTVSALALDTTDPFYDVTGDPDLVAHTPFDAVYVPADNQSHVEITAENALWFRSELAPVVTGVPPHLASPLRLSIAPNPFHGALVFDLSLGDAGPATLQIFGIDGARVRTLLATPHAAGARSLRWDGRDDAGRNVPPGVYFVRLGTNRQSVSRRIVKLD